MGKFKRSITRDIEEHQKFVKEQESLKAKHKIDTDKIIVEKSNMLKFMVKTIQSTIRVTASITLFVFAAIGIMALIYPEPRHDLIEVGNNIYMQLKQYLAF